ncbi:hypothetical protein BHE74_00059358 [Ensete ventricosum]|nr:hypothetical protein GW17_00010971 [Ensete ventricosum]RWW35680.1 hypothetical protein BHE74_00059358 [Ensete ventricosum]RZS28417.1 hypothetical protein BHM03_00061998 [Ensete ventricosum]
MSSRHNQSQRQISNQEETENDKRSSSIPGLSMGFRFYLCQEVEEKEEAIENALPVTSCENEITRVGCRGIFMIFSSHFVVLASRGKFTDSLHNMRASPLTARERKIPCSSHFGGEAFNFSWSTSPTNGMR